MHRSEPQKQGFDRLSGIRNDHNQVATAVSGGGAPPFKFWMLWKCNFQDCGISHDALGSVSSFDVRRASEANNPILVCKSSLEVGCEHDDKCGFSHKVETRTEGNGNHLLTCASEGGGKQTKYVSDTESFRGRRPSDVEGSFNAFRTHCIYNARFY